MAELLVRVAGNTNHLFRGPRVTRNTSLAIRSISSPTGRPTVRSLGPICLRAAAAGGDVVRNVAFTHRSSPAVVGRRRY